MTRRKKTVLILLSIFPGLPLLLIVAALAIRGCDEPPPYDADLKVQRLEIPADQNSFTYLQKAIEKLDKPSRQVPVASAKAGQKQEGEVPESEWDLFYAILSDTRWDAAFVERLLKRNAEALALCEQALAAPHFQAPEVKVLWDTPPNVFDYLSMANLINVRARAAAKRGDYEAAFADGLKLMRFGWCIEGDKGGLMEYLVGTTVHGMGNGLMRDMLSGCNLPPAKLRHYATELAKYPPDARGLADAFRNEYAFQAEGIEEMRSGSAFSPRVPTPRSFPASGFPDAPAVYILRVISFRPHSTRRTCAQVARARIQDVSKPFKAMTPENTVAPQSNAATDFLSGNLLGGIFCRYITLSLSNVLEQKCSENVAQAATRILLAMKAYKLEKGKLPATLAELVPEYLDSVPLDDYDGQPMRYNATKKVVYSVGKDLKDDGGSTTRAEYVAVKRKEAEAAGEKWTDEDQKGTEAEFDEWDQPDACFEIKF